MIGNLASMPEQRAVRLRSDHRRYGRCRTRGSGGYPAGVNNALAMALKDCSVSYAIRSQARRVPCINATTGVVSAIASAEMALAGMQSRIPTDEVISAMHSVGQLMPSARETALGGLALTPTARYTRELKQTGKITWKERKGPLQSK